jgi:predicted CoA-binding protein
MSIYWGQKGIKNDKKIDELYRQIGELTVESDCLKKNSTS